MIKFIKESYLFLLIFILLLIKEPLYKMFFINEEQYDIITCHNLEEEYNKLLEFNNIDLIYKKNSYNTYVLYKDIYNYLEEITISGGREYFKKYNPVIYDNTLVGIISDVYKNSSKVTLLTNKDTNLSVKVNDNIGVLTSENNKLVVKNISNYSDIFIGDQVFTSGIGYITNEIYIGTVEKVIDKGLEKHLIINYDIDIVDINYITVLGEES